DVESVFEVGPINTFVEGLAASIIVGKLRSLECETRIGEQRGRIHLDANIVGHALDARPCVAPPLLRHLAVESLGRHPGLRPVRMDLKSTPYEFEAELRLKPPRGSKSDVTERADEVGKHHEFERHGRTIGRSTPERQKGER